MKKLFLVTIVTVFVSACTVNPVTGKREFASSEKWEKSAGANYHKEILKQYLVYDDPALQEYVNDIGQRLAAQSERPNLGYTFTVLDSPEVNAFALPGGYIYISRGIMAYMENEAQLAGVIGHEIGHVTAKHGAQRHAQQQLAGIASLAVAIGTGNDDLTQLSQVLGGALIKGYGRKQELQSDSLGAKYIALSNYDVDEMLNVIGILKNQELFAAERAVKEGRATQSYHGLFASHPKNDARLQTVIKAADDFRGASSITPDSGAFARLTNGMVFGESEEQGITRANKFYHKGLDVFIQFPKDWRLINQPSQLVGVSPDSNQYCIVQIAEQKQGQSLESVVRAKFAHVTGGRYVQVPSGKAYTATAHVRNERTGAVSSLLVGARTHGNYTYLIIGQGKYSLPKKAFYNVFSDMRALRKPEISIAEGRRIKWIQAKRGDTFARLAQKSKLGKYAESQLRLMNNMYPDGEPSIGEAIKIIE